MVYLWSPGAAGAQGEQSGFVVGDQGARPRAHARHVGFEEPPGAQPPSLLRHKRVVTAVGEEFR